MEEMFPRITQALLAMAIAASSASPALRAAVPAAAELDALVELYTELHKAPELSFYEEKTAAKLTAELRKLGFEVTEKVGGHGFVALLRNGDGPTVMLRTDLDGLPVVEQTGRPYASDVRTTDDLGADVGVMHACAHDIHMSSFIGAARQLSATKSEWKGTLMMIGQPAEERGAGARAMLADGLYAKFPVPDAAIALHSHAGLPTGKIAYTMGPSFASVDSVDITIPGVGGHGAWPHMTVDPIVIAAQTVVNLQTIVSRKVDPFEPAVVTVGSIHGGAKHNIIPDEVKLQLTVRSFNDETRTLLLDSIEQITLHTARAAGAPPDREPTVKLAKLEYTPSTYNEPTLGERLVPAWRSALGEEDVVEIRAVTGGEDFSQYGRTPEDVPIFIFWVGTIDPERYEAAQQPGAAPLPSLHSPLYWPEPRESIKTGVTALTAAARELLD